MGVNNEAVQMMLLGDAVEHARVGVMVWNAERRYVAVNAHAARLVGTTREEMLEQPVGSTNRSPEAQETIDAILDRAPARGVMNVNGRDLEWVVFPTTLIGLDHIVGLLWDPSEIDTP